MTPQAVTLSSSVVCPEPLQTHRKAGIMTATTSPAYCSFIPRPFSQVVKVSPLCRNTRPPSLPSPIQASLSAPFPLLDAFSFPAVNFSITATSDFRPELIGACLWTTGLYLGFSQRRRWGAIVQSMLKASISKVLPDEISDLVASSLHTLPFLAAGFGTDAALRYANGSNAVWAVASGLSVAMYGGIYELARQSARYKKVSSEDKDAFKMFGEFSDRRLMGTGRCHLIDIREAARQDPQARRLVYLSDETLRRFIRNSFPRASRSPNGYYRGLSIRQDSATTQQERHISSSSSPK